MRAERAAPEVADRRRALAALALAYGAALAAALAVAWALPLRHPVAVAAAADLAATAVVFAASVLCDNSSLYDPYWSVAPVPIALYWAAAGTGARRWLALGLVVAWGARLTANQLRRWRGLADEDFRYREIRARTGRGYWPASLVGIHLLPTAWVFLGLLALFPALALPGRPLGPLDAAGALVAAAGVAIEATADRQLRAFRRRPPEPGAVLSAGLWRLSRHPNYFGEVLFWWGLFLLGVAARPAWAWTAIGPLAITLLFLRVSVPWMDRHMLSRHPAFAERLRSTPALVPWPRRR